MEEEIRCRICGKPTYSFLDICEDCENKNEDEWERQYNYK